MASRLLGACLAPGAPGCGRLAGLAAAIDHRSARENAQFRQTERSAESIELDSRGAQSAEAANEKGAIPEHDGGRCGATPPAGRLGRQPRVENLRGGPAGSLLASPDCRVSGF